MAIIERGRRRLERVVSLAVAALTVFSVAQQAAAQVPRSCSQTAGQARAARLARHCMSVSMATHPPCNAANDCVTIAEHVKYMCAQEPPEAPFCQEDAALAAAQAPLSALRTLSLLWRTARADAAQITAEKASLAALQQRIEPLANAHQQAATALQKGLAVYAADVKSANAAYAQYSRNNNVAGSKGLPEARQALHDKFSELNTRGATLAKAESDFGNARAQLAPLVQPLMLGVVSTAPLPDLKDASSIAKGLLAQVLKPPAQPPSKPAVPARSAATSATTDDGAQARALVAQIADLEKAATADVAASDKQRKALIKLSAWGSKGDTLRPNDASDLKALQASRSGADNSVGRLDSELKSFAARHRSDAPSAKAKQCDIQKVDFRNFDYPGTITKVRGGKAVGTDFDTLPERPYVGSVEYLNAGADAKEPKQVAVVYLEMPMMGPHQSPYADIHFFTVDEQCRIQHIDDIAGEIQEGKLTGKSYTYSEAAYRHPPPEGQSAFADGLDKVEVRYFNDAIHEVRRTPAD